MAKMSCKRFQHTSCGSHGHLLHLFRHRASSATGRTRMAMRSSEGPQCQPSFASLPDRLSHRSAVTVGLSVNSLDDCSKHRQPDPCIQCRAKLTYGPSGIPMQHATNSFSIQKVANGKGLLEDNASGHCDGNSGAGRSMSRVVAAVLTALTLGGDGHVGTEGGCGEGKGNRSVGTLLGASRAKEEERYGDEQIQTTWVVVTQFDGTEHCLEYVPSETINEFKKRIYERTGDLPSSQTLIFNAAVLVDDTAALIDVGVRNEARLHLVVEQARVCPQCRDLFVACEQGHGHCTRALLEGKAEINKVGHKGCTALMLACREGHEQCTRTLIEAKSDLEKQVASGELSGFSGLMFSALEGHDQCIRALIEAGADIDKSDEEEWTALMFACRNGYEQCARALTEATTDVDNLEKTNRHGLSALMLSAHHGHDQCAEALLNRQAQINVQNKDGVTALMKACQKGHDQCARVLIKARADLDIQMVHRFTALMISAQNGHDQCTLALIEAGANR